MIGILFHGPEVFDSGWARSILAALSEMGPVRCVLAGTMGRTAALDSGLPGIECPGLQPSEILKQLQIDSDGVVFASCGKCLSSGLLHGSMIAARAGVSIPLVQIECSGGVFVEWNAGSRPEVLEVLKRRLGLTSHEKIENPASCWGENGRTYRRLATAAVGDFVLVEGIVIGKATRDDVVIECEERRIVRVTGAEIKTHGLEKLERLGGVDLRTVKIASTRALRGTEHTPRVVPQAGKGIAFVDHTAMAVYDRTRGTEGAVTVGDDTTAIIGDILFRFQKRVIGITDGDKDVILEDARMTPGSVVLTVREDDVFGLRVFSEIFEGRAVIDDTFDQVRERVSALAGDVLIGMREY